MITVALSPLQRTEDALEDAPRTEGPVSVIEAVMNTAGISNRKEYVPAVTVNVPPVWRCTATS